MASYHAEIKHGKNGKEHADYIQREGKYATGERAQQLIYKEHGNLPEWANDNPSEFFGKAEEGEGANRRVYTEIEIALPNELNKEQQIELVKEIAQKEVGPDKAYVLAIHEDSATLDPEKKNPHAHIQFSERKNDGIERGPDQYFKRYNAKHPERGGAQKDGRLVDKGRKQIVREIRSDIEKIQNNALEKAGHEVRVDCRSLAAQRKEALERGDHKKAAELDRPPESHLGPKVAGQVAKEVARVEEKKVAKIGRELSPDERKEIRRDVLANRPEERAQQVGAVRDYKQERAELQRYIEEQRRLEKTYGDQRTPDEKRKGIELDPEENARRSSAKVYDLQRDQDRAAAALPKVAAAVQETPAREELKKKIEITVQDFKKVLAEKKLEAQAKEKELEKAVNTQLRTEYKKEMDKYKEQAPDRIAAREAAQQRTASEIKKEQKDLREGKPGFLSGKGERAKWEQRREELDQKAAAYEKENQRLGQHRVDPDKEAQYALEKNPAKAKEIEKTAIDKCSARPDINRIQQQRAELQREARELNHIKAQLEVSHAPAGKIVSIDPGKLEHSAGRIEMGNTIKNEVSRQKETGKEISLPGNRT